MPNFVEEHDLAVAGKREGNRTKKHVKCVCGNGRLKQLPLIVFRKRVIAFTRANKRYRGKALRNPAGDREREGDSGDPTPFAHGRPRPFELISRNEVVCERLNSWRRCVGVVAAVVWFMIRHLWLLTTVPPYVKRSAHADEIEELQGKELKIIDRENAIRK
jgi:hypothetical protein